jgi:hypothetical protein
MPNLLESTNPRTGQGLKNMYALLKADELQQKVKDVREIIPDTKQNIYYRVHGRIRQVESGRVMG